MNSSRTRNGLHATAGARVAVLALFLSFVAAPCSAGPLPFKKKAEQLLAAAGTRSGVIVHLGCHDGHLTRRLGSSERFIVHGLDDNSGAVEVARRHGFAPDSYGRISFAQFRGGRLPYVDNLVNLVVVSDQRLADMQEIARVLAPNGVVLIRTNDPAALTKRASPLVPKAVENPQGWVGFVKPWPEEIDEWTHLLHSPDNNAVGHDRRVGAPRHLQWIAEPRHLRSHEHLNSVSALVSSHGRIFYIIDEGPTAAAVAPPQWRLVAREAFNGMLLWKRDIGPWEGHFRLFRSGPPDTARRLVAVGDTVYATLGYGKQVAAFDAATGDVLRTYDATKGALELVYDQGKLFVVAGVIDEQAYAEAAKRYYPSPEPRQKRVVALDAESGRLLWQRADQDTAELMPTTLAVAGERVFFQNTRQLICLDAGAGRELWKADRPAQTTRLSWSAPTLVVCDDVVLSADGPTGGLPPDARRGNEAVKWIMSDKDIRRHPPGDLIAFCARTGKQLWSSESLQGFCCPADVFVIDGLVWPVGNVAPGQQMLGVALDLRTGEVKRRHTGDRPPVGGHARCYRNKATERFLVLGGSGIELLDLDNFSWTADRWVRGTCQYGVMPCNGLIYVPPDSCACLPNVRLHGFTALAPQRDMATAAEEEQPSDVADAPRLEKGPAFGKCGSRNAEVGIADAEEDTSSIPHSAIRIPHSDNWATYRKDGARSGWTKSAVSAELKPGWQTKIGGRLTSPTVAGGRVYVLRVEAHTVHALDANTGRTVWSRTAGGPVDSPPTIARGLAVFGCRDGWVYCLRADDGRLAWRYRAAPQDQLLVANGRLESVWPVHGSVLVRDDLVWCAAGRSSYLDGGIHLLALDLVTGKPIVTKRLDGRDPTCWTAPNASRNRAARNRMPGALPDILSASGEHIVMGWTCFDAEGNVVVARQPHLFSATGYLDDSWWHRTYWQFGNWMRGGFGGWPQAARQTTAGRLLVVTDEAIFGFGREKYDVGNPQGVHAGHVGVIKDGYQDSGRVDHAQNPYRLFRAVKPGTASGAQARRGPVEYTWQVPVSILVRAMLLADETLLIAGPDAEQHNQGLAKIGTLQPGRLLAVSAADGEVLADYEFAAGPRFDGMAAVAGRVFISCQDGSVVCLAAAGEDVER